MKKTISVILALLLLISLCPVALATNGVDISLSLSDTELKEPGYITIEIAISNTSEADLEQITLSSDGELIEEFGNLGAGKSRTFSTKYFVSESSFGKSIPVEITYITNGETKTVEKSFKVTKKEESVSISTSVSANKNSVSAGDSVEFTFVIENQGEAAISDAKLTAPPLNNGNQIKDTFSLQPGKSHTITYTVELSSDVTVKPVLTYTANGKTHSQNLSSVKVKVDSLSAEVKLSATNTSINPGETVAFDLEIINTGKVDFSDITVYDPYGKKVEILQGQLGAGESMKVQSDFAAKKSGKFSYSVEIKDKNGNKTTVKSNEIEVAVAGNPETGSSDAELKMTVEIDTEKLQETGEVVIYVTVKNTGITPITNIEVSEETLGKIGTIASLANGEETITYKYKLEGSGEVTYTFNAVGTDLQGEIKTAMVQTKVTPVENPNSGSDSIKTMIIIIVIVVVIIIGLLIAFIVVYKKDKKNGRKGRPSKHDGKRPTTRNAAVSKKNAQTKNKGNYGDRNNF